MPRIEGVFIICHIFLSSMESKASALGAFAKAKALALQFKGRMESKASALAAFAKAEALVLQFKGRMESKASALGAFAKAKALALQFITLIKKYLFWVLLISLQNRNHLPSMASVRELVENSSSHKQVLIRLFPQVLVLSQAVFVYILV